MESRPKGSVKLSLQLNRFFGMACSFASILDNIEVEEVEGEVVESSAEQRAAELEVSLSMRRGVLQGMGPSRLAERLHVLSASQLSASCAKHNCSTDGVSMAAALTGFVFNVSPDGMELQQESNGCFRSECGRAALGEAISVAKQHAPPPAAKGRNASRKRTDRKGPPQQPQQQEPCHSTCHRDLEVCRRSNAAQTPSRSRIGGTRGKGTRLIVKPSRNIPAAALARVCQEIMADMGYHNFRFSSSALDCLQAVAEAWLSSCFASAQIFATHARRSTIMLKDLQLWKRVHDESWANEGLLLEREESLAGTVSKRAKTNSIH